MAEERLISDLVNRLGSDLAINRADKPKIDVDGRIILQRKHEEALISLSCSKLNTIVSGLVDLLESIGKQNRETNEEAIQRHVKSQLYILGLLGKCLAYQWDHIKAQFKNVTGLDEKEKIRLKEKEEQILPPPLEEGLANNLVQLINFFLLRTHPFNSAELHSKAGFILFQLSASNYEAVFS